MPTFAATTAKGELGMTGWSRVRGDAAIVALLVALAAAPALAFNPADRDAFNATGNCPGCDLSGLEMRSLGALGANLAGANLSDTTMTFANLQGADLSGANLTNARMAGANLSNGPGGAPGGIGAIYPVTNLSGAILIGVDLGTANLTNANLTRADLRGANLSDANLTGADLTGAVVTVTSFARANFSGANLTGLDLDVANTVGAKFCNTTMPDGVMNRTGCAPGEAEIDPAELCRLPADQFVQLPAELRAALDCRRPVGMPGP